MKYSLIAACDKNNGIGYLNGMPWRIPREMAYFRKITKNTTVIMGRKTWESVGQLPYRNCLVVSSSGKHKTFNEALSASTDKVFVIGGAQLYASTIENCQYIYLTRIDAEYECDTYFPPIPPFFKIISSTVDNELNFLIYENIRDFDSAENQYINALKQIMQQPARLGRNGLTRSAFHFNHAFDMDNGFPLFTTKYTPFRVIADELIFFLRGQTNTKLLKSKIWEANTSAEFLKKRNLDYQIGEMGPMYGYNWRYFNRPYGESEGGHDQLSALIESLKNDPHSRRHLLTTYNPAVVDEGVLAPCHGLITQFYVENDTLSCSTYQRSADMVLGYPFNVASYALLLHILARICGYKPKYLHITIGDAHIYEEHDVSILINRAPIKFPTLSIINEISLDTLTPDDFTINDYYHHEKIKYNMIA